MSNITIPLSDQDEHVIRQYAFQANLSMEEVISDTVRRFLPHLQFMITSPLPVIETREQPSEMVSANAGTHAENVSQQLSYSHPADSYYNEDALQQAMKIAREEAVQAKPHDASDDFLLQQEFALYYQKQAKLLEKYPDQYVLIKGSYLVATFPEQYDALKFGLAHFGNVSYLVRQITLEEKVVVVA